MGPSDPGQLPGNDRARGRKLSERSAVPSSELPSLPIALQTPTVRLRGLTRRFGSHVALAPLDLELHPGEITGLVGPNGSGKSTLMRLLLGLLPRSGGSISVDGQELRGDGLGVRRLATFAPGELGLYGELSGRAHLNWFLKGRSAQSRKLARELAQRLGLPLSKRVRQYSHGMKRQLLFCSAMAPDVPLRVLDEPTEGLDPTKRSEVLDILEEDRHHGRCQLLSSHHLGEVDRACDRLLFLQGGRLIADERADELAAKSRRLVSVQFAPDQIEGALTALKALEQHGQISPYDSRVSILLHQEDPRPFLKDLCALESLPQPLAIETGRRSLTDLYRDLYGVEGL